MSVKQPKSRSCLAKISSKDINNCRSLAHCSTVKPLHYLLKRSSKCLGIVPETSAKTLSQFVDASSDLSDVELNSEGLSWKISLTLQELEGEDSSDVGRTSEEGRSEVSETISQIVTVATTLSLGNLMT